MKKSRLCAVVRLLVGVWRRDVDQEIYDNSGLMRTINDLPFGELLTIQSFAHSLLEATTKHVTRRSDVLVGLPRFDPEESVGDLW